MKFELRARSRAVPDLAGMALAVLVLVLAVACPGLAAETRLGALVRTDVQSGWVELGFDNGRVRVSMLGEGLLHVRATDDPAFSDFPSFAVREQGPGQAAPAMTDEGSALVLDAGLLRLKVDKKQGTMHVLDREGKLLIEEPAGGGVFFDGESVGCDKVMPADEHYYGFGEKTGPLDKRGTKMAMWNSDMPYNAKADPLYQSHPFYLALRSGRAYGLFFDNTFRSGFDLGSDGGDRLRFSAAGGESDYWVLAGPTPREVLSRYAGLVGTMRLPPQWGLGKHQCRWSYKTDQRVREIWRGYRDRDIPLDAIYLDIHYMVGYRVFTFNPQRFPDPAGLTAELKQDGVHTVVIVDPGVKVDPDYPVYQQGMAKDLFVRDADGGYFLARVWPGDVYFPDYYRPEARQWWGELYRYYLDLGVDGFWCDMNEPAGWSQDIRALDYMVPTQDARWDRMRHGLPPELVHHDRIHNVYALLEMMGVDEGVRRLRPDQRPFLITRSGYSGIQNYALIWTGDNFSTWSSLETSLPMLLNMGLSGLAFVGADIGGFGGAPTRELYARWIELGVFYPFCRTHTSANMPDQEPWSFGPEVTDISREMIKLRYRLLPYTYTVFEESSRTGWPIMRPLVFEFPADPKVANLADQFMWGEWLLVAPVVSKGRDRRQVYLPEGEWYDFFTGEKFSGPADLEVEAPLAKLPLFARAGALIPQAPPMRHTGEKPWDPLTVEVFPGAAASSFVLYEDDGQSLEYLQGKWARTAFHCRPAAGGVELGVEARTGDFDPQRHNLVFKVHGIGPEAQVAVLSATGQQQPASVTYDRNSRTWLIQVSDTGQALTVRMAKE